MNFTREWVARYKCPRWAVFMEELPKTAPGKALEREFTEIGREAYT
jgi:acyl-coenzyme A synthetase/AMP-(fatty) acid ligase